MPKKEFDKEHKRLVRVLTSGNKKDRLGEVRAQIKEVQSYKEKEMHKQGYNDKLDESLGARKGKKSQSMKARRDESKAMEKAVKKRAYSAVKTMDKKKSK